MRALVIANPKAGKGRAGSHVVDALAAAGLVGCELAVTEAAGHGIELARAARKDGRELVVAAGGDGTVHEVVNGLLADGPGAEVPALGLLPLGSGCDYVRTFDIPSDVAVAARLIASEALTEVDVGEVACEGSANRFFVNIAEAGFGATVVARAARLPRALGPAMYLAAFWIELPRFPRPTVGVNAPGEDAFDGRAMNIVIAIGRAFGGGMKVAPSADPSDGLFDVQVHHGSKLDYVRGIPKVFRGTHVPHPRVQEWRVSCVEVTAHPELLIEADGEVLGRTPATFTIIPRALRLRCGP